MRDIVVHLLGDDGRTKLRATIRCGMFEPEVITYGGEYFERRALTGDGVVVYRITSGRALLQSEVTHNG